MRNYSVFRVSRPPLVFDFSDGPFFYDTGVFLSRKLSRKSYN